MLNSNLRNKIISICEQKIEQKGDNLGLSFYAFFPNKNETPSQLMEVATWWIQLHELDHFVKAVKVKEMLQKGL